MDPILLTVGLLMIACAVTLLADGPRSWVLAFAQGIGMQAIVAACVASIQVGFLMGDAAPKSIVDRVQMGVQAMPFVAAGWTGQQIYESTGKGPDESARSDFGDFAIVSSTQVALVSLVLAARRVHASEDRVGDGVQFVLMLLVIANTAINAGWAWWAA
jgi:hypothetical protein